MMPTRAQIKQEALGLPPEERGDLVVEIRDSVRSDDIPAPDWQKDPVLERLAALEGADPEERSIPWEEVRERVFPGKA